MSATASGSQAQTTATTVSTASGISSTIATSLGSVTFSGTSTSSKATPSSSETSSTTSTSLPTNSPTRTSAEILSASTSISGTSIPSAQLTAVVSTDVSGSSTSIETTTVLDTSSLIPAPSSTSVTSTSAKVDSASKNSGPNPGTIVGWTFFAVVIAALLALGFILFRRYRRPSRRRGSALITHEFDDNDDDMEKGEFAARRPLGTDSSPPGRGAVGWAEVSQVEPMDTDKPLFKMPSSPIAYYDQPPMLPGESLRRQLPPLATVPIPQLPTRRSPSLHVTARTSNPFSSPDDSSLYHKATVPDSPISVGSASLYSQQSASENLRHSFADEVENNRRQQSMSMAQELISPLESEEATTPTSTRPQGALDRDNTVALSGLLKARAARGRFEA